MSLPNGSNPVVDGLWFRPQLVTPDDATPTVLGQNAIPANARVVQVEAVQNNADDFIILPALADTPNGHEIIILCSAGGNFELRTPASSGEKINNVDSDGTNEYLCTDTEVLKVIKINSTVGWMAYSYTALGAKTTAVIPD